MHWGLQPVALSPWGGLGPNARSWLAEVTKRILVDNPSHSTNTRSTEILQTISLTLAREVARQLSLRCRIVEDIST